MASVRVESSAFGDDRFELLAQRAGLADADHARGKMLRLWRKCTIEKRYVLTKEEVALVLGDRGVEAILAANLGHAVRSGIRISGTKGRIEWLDKIRENGKKGGRPKKTRTKPSGSDESNPPAPSLAPDPSPISDPPPGERSNVTPIRPPVDLDERARRRRAIVQKVMPLHVQAFNRLRMELGKDVPPMAVVGDPAERALLDLLKEMSSLEQAEQECLHVLAIREKEARDKRTLKFFGAMVWSTGTFAAAKTRDLSESFEDRKPARRAGGNAMDALIAAAGPVRGSDS